MSRLQELLPTARIFARPTDRGYRAQVVPDREARKYTDPIVLHECEHHHRSERTALTCGEAWVISKGG